MRLITILMISLVSAIILIVGCVPDQPAAEPSVPAAIPSPQPEPAPVTDEPVGDQLTVEMTADGFVPETLTISVGDTVTWVNNDQRKHWPATDVHPTHTVYPGSGITKCARAAEGELFDSCRPVKVGESWSFSFNEAGSWNYHDHLRPGDTGTIVVE